MKNLLIGTRVIVVEGEYRGRTGHVSGKDWELVLYGLHEAEEDRPYPIRLETLEGREPTRLIQRNRLRCYPKSMPIGKVRGS